MAEPVFVSDRIHMWQKCLRHDTSRKLRVPSHGIYLYYLSPLKLENGRLEDYFPFWDGLFSGVMLVSRTFWKCIISITRNGSLSDFQDLETEKVKASLQAELQHLIGDSQVSMLLIDPGSKTPTQCHTNVFKRAVQCTMFPLKRENPNFYRLEDVAGNAFISIFFN